MDKKIDTVLILGRSQSGRDIDFQGVAVGQKLGHFLFPPWVGGASCLYPTASPSFPVRSPLPEQPQVSHLQGQFYPPPTVLSICPPRLQEEIQLKEEAENNLAAFRGVSSLWSHSSLTSLFPRMAPGLPLYPALVIGDPVLLV